MMKYENKEKEYKFSRDFQCGYLEGLRSQLGGWTQKVKDWYWGNPFVSCEFFSTFPHALLRFFFLSFFFTVLIIEHFVFS